MRALVRDKSLSKQNNSLEKIMTTVESGIPLYPPNHPKNRKVRDLLDLSDSKGEMPTICQSSGLLRERVQLINIEKSE